METVAPEVFRPWSLSPDGVPINRVFMLTKEHKKEDKDRIY